MARKRNIMDKKRKFLVVIDATEECERAVFYAAHRALKSQGSLIFLAVINHTEFEHWLGVGNLIREEATQDMQHILDRHVEQAKAILGSVPDTRIREGNVSEQIHALIEEDEEIVILALAAGVGKDGPGPLVSSLATRSAGTFPIPVTIVPASLSDEEILAVI